MQNDYGHSVMIHNGRYRNIRTARPLDDWGNRDMPTMPCPTCKADLATDAHNLEKHRAAMYANVDESEWRSLAHFTDEDRKELDASVKRHPAGRKLPGAHRNGE